TNNNGIVDRDGCHRDLRIASDLPSHPNVVSRSWDYGYWTVSAANKKRLERALRFHSGSRDFSFTSFPVGLRPAGAGLLSNELGFCSIASKIMFSIPAGASSGGARSCSPLNRRFLICWFF